MAIPKLLAAFVRKDEGGGIFGYVRWRRRRRQLTQHFGPEPIDFLLVGMIGPSFDVGIGVIAQDGGCVSADITFPGAGCLSKDAKSDG
jgi:hypothetical protein